ncbi:MAG: MAPEG family protein [Psychrobium sp.]|nr:MAPEG family protein [Psychrobium sp.]
MQLDILYPLAALLLLIVIVLMIMVTGRFRGVKKGDIRARVFRTSDFAGLDEKYISPTNNYNNLLQLPPLFMLFVLFALQLSLVDTVFIVASWVFVITRYTHSIIHLGYNNVMHRLLAFATGLIVLIFCWSRLLYLTLV